jgi:hypothetical protein
MKNIKKNSRMNINVPYEECTILEEFLADYSSSSDHPTKDMVDEFEPSYPPKGFESTL